MPASSPPALFVGRLTGTSGCVVAPESGRISSWICEPGRSATRGPMPMPTPLIAWMDINAWARRPSSLRSHCTWLPSPIGRPRTITSKLPPTVSPAPFVASMTRFICCSTSALTQFNSESAGMASTSSNVTASGLPIDADPMLTMCETMRMPSCPRNCLQMAPTATRAAVSRALARSRTLRISVWSYFTTPARSTWPGRGRVTAGRSWPGVSAVGGPSTAIVRCQFSQSLLAIISEIGAPVVTP